MAVSLLMRVITYVIHRSQGIGQPGGLQDSSRWSERQRRPPETIVRIICTLERCQKDPLGIDHPHFRKRVRFERALWHPSGCSQIFHPLPEVFTVAPTSGYFL